ncbi:hypothetical protein G3I28_26430, partial [Streptomyces sp. SID10116]|nr:hypothetical protein [Streptomyces sp. SID10116]
MTHDPSAAVPFGARLQDLREALPPGLRRNAPVLPVVLMIALLALPAPTEGASSGGGGTGG